MDGLLVVDKPAGPTSHDVVAVVRRVAGGAKVGHTGTLDPMATGVLPIVIGRATRLARFLAASDKEYEAGVRLGWATDTYDAAGSPVPAGDTEVRGRRWPDAASLDRALDTFRGTYLQAPPGFSAKKVDGVRAYELARKGQAVTPREVEVTVHDLSILGCDGDVLRVRIRCSAGFYVRSFAHALGQLLGPGAHLLELRRTRAGDCTAGDAVALDALQGGVEALGAALVPLSQMLPSLPGVVVTAAGAVRARHGNDLRPGDCVGGVPAWAGHVRVFDPEGALVALAEARLDAGFLHPDVVVG